MSGNPWIMHVKRVQAQKGISYKEAMRVASKSYRKQYGGSQDPLLKALRIIIPRGGLGSEEHVLNDIRSGEPDDGTWEEFFEELPEVDEELDENVSVFMEMLPDNLVSSAMRVLGPLLSSMIHGQQR
jgi:hypothetical protein